MKNTTLLLTLTLTLASFFATVTGFAQDADGAFKEYKKLRDDRETKPNPAHSQRISDAGTTFLAEYASDTRRARQVVNELLSYGTNNLSKDKILRADWYAKLNYAVVDKQYSARDDKTKAAFAALAAAIAEGEVLDNVSSGQALSSWRAKIDTLAGMPESQPYILDREKGFYAVMSRARGPNAQKIAELQINELSKSKDRDTANWAKQEIKLSELRKTPISFAFTTLDGKEFDLAKRKGTPALYVYFWKTNSKNVVGELDKLMYTYYDFGRKQVEFVVFCYDAEDKRAEVLATVKKAKVKCPVYFDGAGAKGELYQKLVVTGDLTGHLFNNKGELIQTNVKPGDLKRFIK